MESALYGIQVISVTKANLAKLDSIQANFAADMIGVRRTCSHVAIRRELGWSAISTIIMRRKLLYWARLSKLGEDTWASKALNERMSAENPQSGTWNSKYRQEILDIHSECRVGDVLKDGKTAEHNIKQAI